MAFAVEVCDGGALPSGTVTFLFTDIEGSTAWWERFPVAMRAALARHDELMRAAVHSGGGIVFSTGGDGLAAAFARASDAVAAAVHAQRAFSAEVWSEPVVLVVRMGVHTGEAQERDGDYFGTTVNRAARIMGVAEGGQVLVSLATVEVVRGELPDAVGLVDLGLHGLRSLAQPERLFQLVWPGVRPHAVRSDVGAGQPGNLPRVERLLLGREREVEVICALLNEHAIVTLTGVGGVGKTSLALGVARKMASGFADGVWFCELASVLDPGEVAQSVAATMGLRPQAGLSQLDLVLRALSHQRCLLVLDNCEHVLEGAASLAEGVLANSDGITILATSREGLGVVDERIVAVRPLASEDAVRLFHSHASAHEGGFRVTKADDPLVSEVCERLDGLPLAIELAAARARSMPLADLASRLSEGFRLLRGQRRATERHQTLRATVAWSYALLSATEQRLFDRLSVFVGGFTLSAAEAVCAGDGPDLLSPLDVDELVAALADKSMVLAGPSGRYVLLETLRQFGEERLHATSDPDRFREAHLVYFTAFVSAAHDGLQGPNEGHWWQRVQAEWANVRAAINCALSSGNVDAAATIATQLIWAATWHDTGEPLVWIDTVAAMPGVEGHPLWGSVLGGQAWAAWDRGDMAQAHALGRQALAVEGPESSTVDHVAEFALLSALYFTQQPEAAQTYLDRIVSRANIGGHHGVEATYAGSQSIFHYGAERYEEAVAAARHSRQLAEACGNPNAIAWSLCQEGVALTELGREEAITVLLEALSIAEPVGAVTAANSSRRALAKVYLAYGRTDEAAALVAQSLQSFRRKSAWMFLRQTLFHAADVLICAGAFEPAAILHGAIRESSAAGVQSTIRLMQTRKASAVEVLGEVRYEELALQGQALSAEKAALLAEVALASLLARVDSD